jgi:hypothetical protein
MHIWPFLSILRQRADALDRADGGVDGRADLIPARARSRSPPHTSRQRYGLDGYDVWRMKPREALHFSVFS